MLTHLRYGTYIFFGLLTFGGAAFIWLFFPETKGLSLEEMDVIFGSVGIASADEERYVLNMLHCGDLDTLVIRWSLY